MVDMMRAGLALATLALASAAAAAAGSSELMGTRFGEDKSLLEEEEEILEEGDPRILFSSTTTVRIV